MEVTCRLVFSCSDQWREWLQNNHSDAKECWVALSSKNGLSYQDSVYEALCFGWIDSTAKRLNGCRIQRFTPRRKGSNWTELNKARARYLIAEGRMTDAGLAVLPDIYADFIVAEDIVKMMIESGIYEQFKELPDLYIRVKIGNAEYRRKHMPDEFHPYLKRLIEDIRKGRMRDWNDNGRLI